MLSISDRITLLLQCNMDAKDILIHSHCPPKKCIYESSNIFGRSVCRIIGKLNCDNCEYRPVPGMVWALRFQHGGLVFLSRKPIKSSLGYLWGYPTMVTNEEPFRARLSIQGTASRSLHKGCIIPNAKVLNVE